MFFAVAFHFCYSFGIPVTTVADYTPYVIVGIQSEARVGSGKHQISRKRLMNHTLATAGGFIKDSFRFSDEGICDGTTTDKQTAVLA